MNVDEAIIALQKQQLSGNGKCELLNKYDGMVQEIESFTVRYIEVDPKNEAKDWIAKSDVLEITDIENRANTRRVVRIVTGNVHNNS